MSKRKPQKKRRPKAKGLAGAYRFMKSEFPLHGCWINQDWQTSSMAYITVVRKMPSGLLVFANFLVNTARNEFGKCFGDAQLTEERLRRDLIDANPEIPMFKIDFEIVQKILAAAFLKLQNREEQPTPPLSHCLQLIGPLDEYLEQARTQEIAPENFPIAITLRYRIGDIEEIEAEVIQIPDVEESDYSRPGNKQYYWFAAEKKGWLRSARPTEPVARISLKEDELQLDIREERNRERLDSQLLKYLGTAAEPLQ